MVKCNICLEDLNQEQHQLDSISTKLFKDIIVEIFHIQVRIFILHFSHVIYKHFSLMPDVPSK